MGRCWSRRRWRIEREEGVEWGWGVRKGEVLGRDAGGGGTVAIVWQRSSSDVVQCSPVSGCRAFQEESMLWGSRRAAARLRSEPGAHPSESASVRVSESSCYSYLRNMKILRFAYVVFVSGNVS